MTSDTFYQILVPYVSDDEQAEIETEFGSPSDYEADEQVDMTAWIKQGNQIPQEHHSIFRQGQF